MRTTKAWAIVCALALAFGVGSVACGSDEEPSANPAAAGTGGTGSDDGGPDGAEGESGVGGSGNSAGAGGTGGTAGTGATGGTGGTGTGGTGGVEPPDIDLSPYIVVDQFGYLPGDQKIAVLRDPQQGWDETESFAPGNTYALVESPSGNQVLTGSSVPWNGGATDPSSGDKAFWFDFSSVQAPGTYYVLDVEKNVRSPQFRIGESVYRDVLKHAMRTFFYQRAGQEKTAAHAGASWADGPSHVGALQDRNCRRWNAPSDGSTERDLSGGWYDAGDYNKYTNWHAHYVVSMLRAYHRHPSAFSDDYGMPESGNGIPDILDEAKWGMDWLVRMQNSDGSVLSIVGVDHASPPSAATGQSLYGDASTSATLSAASAFAYGATVFGEAGMTAYAKDLRDRATDAWSWAQANPQVTFQNNEGPTAGLGAGKQEVDDHGRLMRKIEAAIHLFELTGEAAYRTFVDANHQDVHLMQWSYAYSFEEREQEMLLHYASLPGATPAVATAIRSTYQDAMDGSDNFAAFDGKTDPYLAHLADYTWGSNGQKASLGNMYMSLVIHDIHPSRAADARQAALGYLHYLHGVNPFGMVYLSNMYGLGAEKSANEFYHSWFSDGSPWDRVGTSAHGPAPGFLTGGPNPSYDWDGCCPSSCGSAQNNAVCTSEPIDPPRNQPNQKSYKDFNTTWPLNSWEVTENSNGYQLPYIRLLSSFVP